MEMPEIRNEKQLRAAMAIKKCDARAQAIVVSLLERHVSPQTMLQRIKYIKPVHYNDVVDERNILQLCGYPLCGQDLTDTPKQRYQICTSTNKVFDLTERKKFCSWHCYRASIYIQSQLQESPLWLRDSETTPAFQLLEKEQS